MILKQQVETTQRQKNLPFLCSKVLVWYGLLFGLGFNSVESGSAHQSWIRSCFLVSDFVMLRAMRYVILPELNSSSRRRPSEDCSCFLVSDLFMLRAMWFCLSLHKQFYKQFNSKLTPRVFTTLLPLAYLIFPSTTKTNCLLTLKFSNSSTHH